MMAMHASVEQRDYHVSSAEQLPNTADMAQPADALLLHSDEEHDRPVCKVRSEQ